MVSLLYIKKILPAEVELCRYKVPAKTVTEENKTKQHKHTHTHTHKRLAINLSYSFISVLMGMKEEVKTAYSLVVYIPARTAQGDF